MSHAPAAGLDGWSGIGHCAAVSKFAAIAAASRRCLIIC
jgi:hypothetical protein